MFRATILYKYHRNLSLSLTKASSLDEGCYPLKDLNINEVISSQELFNRSSDDVTIPLIKRTSNAVQATSWYCICNYAPHVFIYNINPIQYD